MSKRASPPGLGTTPNPTADASSETSSKVLPMNGLAEVIVPFALRID
ncbi:MAG: hypothetical protein JWQ92_35 [Amnibacterium sp.]|nr:hypothetical protein [Amnibacterium sp.]